jgi:hypothetical protein
VPRGQRDGFLQLHSRFSRPELGDNIATINNNTETLIDASKEVGLEINIEKTKYMLLFHH